MIRRALGCLVVAVALSGCGSPFLHSPATGGSVVTDPGLVGAWEATEPVQVRAVIAPDPGVQPGVPYTAALTVHDKGQLKTTLGVELTLTEIGGARFADLFLGRADRDKLVGTYGVLAVPVHQVMKIVREGDTLTVRPFKGDWLEGDAKGADFAHTKIAVGGGETVLVTGPTKELQELLARHANDPDAFDDPIVFRRAKN